MRIWVRAVLSRRCALAYSPQPTSMSRRPKQDVVSKLQVKLDVVLKTPQTRAQQVAGRRHRAEPWPRSLGAAGNHPHPQSWSDSIRRGGGGS